MFRIIKNILLGFIQNCLEPCPQLNKKTKNMVEIGFSISKRPINCFSIGNGDNKILFLSGIHGNEVGTVKLSFKLIKWLLKNYKRFRNCTFFVIPCLNPDGYTLACSKHDYTHGGKIGRFNDNGVDLNRNFPTKDFTQNSIWSFGKNYQEKQTIYCGKHGGSEPEMQSLVNFVIKEKINFCYSFHNAGKDVMGACDRKSIEQAKNFSKYTGFHIITESEWKKLAQTGTAKAWCEMHDIGFLEIEGSSRYGSDWNHQKKAIEAGLKVFE